MRVSKKFVRLGTNPDEISGSDIPANYTPTDYTQTSNDIAGHLEGIDNSLASVPQQSAGDLNELSFNLANNQTTLANITGLAFNNAVVRSAEIHYSIYIDATTDLYETGTIIAIQRGSSWLFMQNNTGDNSQISFDIDTNGQVQYTSGNISGFVSGVLKARAITTSV